MAKLARAKESSRSVENNKIGDALVCPFSFLSYHQRLGVERSSLQIRACKHVWMDSQHGLAEEPSRQRVERERRHQSFEKKRVQKAGRRRRSTEAENDAAKNFELCFFFFPLSSSLSLSLQGETRRKKNYFDTEREPAHPAPMQRSPCLRRPQGRSLLAGGVGVGGRRASPRLKGEKKMNNQRGSRTFDARDLFRAHFWCACRRLALASLLSIRARLSAYCRDAKIRAGEGEEEEKKRL